MKSAQPPRTSHSHGDLHALEVIEDTSGARRKHGLPLRYSKGRFLGKGGFAKVYEVQDMESKEVFAAKIVTKASVVKPRAHAKLRSEIAIHRSLDHDKVVKFYDYFEDEESVYILLELCPNQTLNELVRRRPAKRLTEPEAMFYVYDLILALKYLHRRRIIHRDLKLGNLFLDEHLRLKVGDFGLAAQLESDGDRRRTICGTPNYIAPEILEGRTGHSYEVDIWSLGVIVYTMLVGRPPFETSDVKTTYKRIRQNQYTFPEAVRLSQSAKDLITMILRTDPRCRPSLDEILAAPWFQTSKLPPPLPLSLNPGLGASPRLSAGYCSARSETPERGVADFARIDSPAHRFPLREVSPGLALGQPHPAHGRAMQRGLSAAPVLQTERVQVNLAAPAPPAGTPARYQYVSGALVSSRPHLGPKSELQPSLQENIPPAVGPNGQHSSEPRLHPSYTQSRSPASTAAEGAARCRTPLQPTPGPTPRLTPGLGHLQAPQPQAPPARGGLFRDLSPVPPAPSARATGHLSARPGPSPPTAPSSYRAAVSSLKENVSRSARPLVTCAEGGAPLTKPSPNAVLPVQRQASRGNSTHTLVDLGLVDKPQLEKKEILPKEDPLKSLVWAEPKLYSSRSGKLLQAEQPITVSPLSSQLGSARCPQVISVRADCTPELWVTKWVDYSSKYGVGYCLSDGCIGVYFNDSTKMILVPDCSSFDYITRRTQEKQEERSTHMLSAYPEDLKKKVTLLRHFKSYLMAETLEKKDGAMTGESGLPPPGPRDRVRQETSQAPYVKKWTKNKHAIMFQLSNKIVQVVFFDKTEAVMCSRSHLVTYVAKNGEVSTHSLANALDISNSELAKRLRYTKDILVNLLGPRNAEVSAR